MKLETILSLAVPFLGCKKNLVEAKNFVPKVGTNGAEGASGATGYRAMRKRWPVLPQKNGRNKPFCELGKLLDALARSRGVHGPYNISHHIESVSGHTMSGQAVSKSLYGNSRPKRGFIAAFADAFELTLQERIELAWVYAYDFPMPQEGKVPHDSRRLYTSPT